MFPEQKTKSQNRFILGGLVLFFSLFFALFSSAFAAQPVIHNIIPASQFSSATLTINGENFGISTASPAYSPDIDANRDGIIDILELSLLATSYRKEAGQPGYIPRADFNHDNIVDIIDLSKLACAYRASTGTNYVEFPGGIRAKTLSWSEAQITCKVPYGTTSGEVLVVTSSGRSNAAGFTLKNPLKINNGGEYTNSASVTLNLSGISGISQMQFSNNGLSWSNPEPFALSKGWAIPAEDGIKSVYVKLKDSSGRWAHLYSDTIILDTTPPVITITSPLNGAIIEEAAVQLEGTVDAAPFSETRTLANPGENTITKTATDPAGNSASSSVSVYYYSGTLIGPEGGEVTSLDGKVKVVIPAAALTQAVQIKILPLDAETLEGAAPSGQSLLSVVECKPYGLVFNLAATLIYTLNQAEVPGTPVALGLYDSIQKEILFTGATSVVPTDGVTVSFPIAHFSTYAALKTLTPQGTPIGGGVKIPLPDMFTGAFSHAIPISVPPGRKGMQPSIGLVYRSSNANSWVGLGFSLNPGYIVRSTRLGPPTYNDIEDTFYFVTDSGTTELVWLVENLYQSKIESGFAKFYKEANDTWRVAAKDGSALFFGQSPDSKEGSGLGTFSWQLTRAVDNNGNYIEYTYTKDQGKSYLLRIDYTGNENVGASPRNSVEFFLEARQDIPSTYISSAKIATARRLNRIEVKANSEPVWEYLLEYEYSPDTHRSLLRSVKQFGADGRMLPQQSLSYQEAE